jgi:glycogen phosphorylase
MQDANALAQLALDMSWSWNHSPDDVWKRLNPEMRELTANPWLMLQSISPERLERLTDAGLRARFEEVLADVNDGNSAPGGSKPRTRLLRSAPWLTSAWSTC